MSASLDFSASLPDSGHSHCAVRQSVSDPLRLFIKAAVQEFSLQAEFISTAQQLPARVVLPVSLLCRELTGTLFLVLETNPHGGSMRDLFRILILGGIILGAIWFYQSQQNDQPVKHFPDTSSSLQEDEEQENDGQPGWSQEERATWRDGVNRRLMR